MIYELFLEGELADIRQDLGMQLSYNIDDVNKYGSRDTSFSKTIVLPGTAKNNKLLGFVGELGSNNPYANGAPNINSNFNPAQTTKAELRANGLLLLKGVFRLTGIIHDKGHIEYEGNLFGELGGFIAAIGAGKLEELDFSEYDHTYTRNNIVNSWNTVNGYGYYYPLIDYGTYSTPEKNPGRVKKDYDYRTFRPALFIKEYIDKVFENSGYTYESEFFNSAFFKKLIMPCNVAKLIKTVTDLLQATRSARFIIPDSRNSFGEYNLQYTNINLTNNFTGNGNPSFIYTGAPTEVEIKFNIKGHVTLSNTNGFLNITLVAGGEIKFSKLYSYTNTLSFPFNESITTSAILDTNDTVYILIEAFNTWNPVDRTPTSIELSSISVVSRNPIAADLKLNDQILFDKIIPKNILQKDFFIWLVKMFNLYIVEKPILDNSSKPINYFLSAVVNGPQNAPYNSSGLLETSPFPWTDLILNNFTNYNNGGYQYTGENLKLSFKVNMKGVFYIREFRPADSANWFIFYLRVIRLRNGVTTTVSETQIVATPNQTLNVDLSLNFVENVKNGDVYMFRYNLPVNKITPLSVINYSSFEIYKKDPDTTGDVLYIEPYVDYWNLDQPIDWTYKAARDKAWNIKPMGMLNGRFFEYKYKEDNDFYNEAYKKKYNLPYGSRLEDTFFQFAKDKQTVDIGFSPTPLIEYEGTDKVVSAIYKKSSGNAVDQEERMDSNIRILMAKKMTGVASWYIRNNDISGSGGNLGAALTVYGYAGHFDDPVNPTKDINFGAASEIYFEPNVYPTNNLFNDYWSAYIAEIADKDSKLLTCHVYLTEMDIAQLDFSKPVFIDGVLWRINKIMDYDATNGELTKVELLKVINNG